MKNLIKLLISIVTTRERLLRSNAKLKSRVELLEIVNTKLMKDTTELIAKTDNLIRSLIKTNDALISIQHWINKHEGSQWKN